MLANDALTIDDFETEEVIEPPELCSSALFAYGMIFPCSLLKGHEGKHTHFVKDNEDANITWVWFRLQHVSTE